MRVGLVLLLASLGLCVAVSPSDAFAAAPTAAAAKAKAKCKPRQVAVSVKGRKSCRPFAQLFPQPKAIDPRLAHLQQVLKFDPAKAVKGKKRKRARTLQSGFGAAGKRVQKKLLRALPRALALIDRKGRGASSSLLRPGPALASKACEYGEPSPIGRTGGASVGAFGDNGGYVNAPIGGGMRVQLTFLSCGGVRNFNIPECPTAAGGVDGAGTGQFRATIEIFDGNQLVSRNSSSFEEKAKVHGEVGADAKLKHIDVEHSQEVFIVASGGIVIRGGVTRRVRIEMPGGRYDPARASARFYGDSISPDSGARSFADTAKAAIDGYRSAESRWSGFDGSYCAKAIFAPPSNTLKLRKDRRDALGIYAQAMDGGRATEARWTLLDPQNAEFSPGSSSGSAPTISYRVTNAPVGGFVSVRVRFTSTAGVGESTWTQPTESTGINFIEGSFGGEWDFVTSIDNESIRHVWSGVVKFERLGPSLGGASGFYTVASGNVSLDSSGIEPTGVTGCHGTGHAQAPLPPGSGTVVVSGAGGGDEPPYTYSVTLNLPLVMYKITRHDCPQAAKDEGYESPPKSEIEYGAVWSLHQEGRISADGLAYVGSEKLEAGNLTLGESWTLHGTE